MRTRPLIVLTGRTELRIFLVIYAFTLALQAITTGAFLEQGSEALVILSAIHAGAVAALFWSLLVTGLVSTQIVEDGTLSSLIVSTLKLSSEAMGFNLINSSIVARRVLYDCILRCDVLHLARRRVLVHLCLWPVEPARCATQRTAVRLDDNLAWRVSPYPSRTVPEPCPTHYLFNSAALLYFLVMLWIVLGILNEIRPVWYYILAAILFILSQLDYFLLNKVICEVCLPSFVH